MTISRAEAGKPKLMFDRPSNVWHSGSSSEILAIASSVLMAEVILLWLALLRLAGLLDLARKPLAAFAVMGAVALGAAAFFYTSRLLRSEEAEVLAQRLPLPERLRAYLG